ncbi:pentapeptide repeat-containing protein [Nonomuraea spiralis]|uniref:Pentapeptide repeat-containing protein n=1 Tax=Nonomuraea spiralis TaxID=46182 RepID=A0ABV5IK79_9ACTN|nr:pentapeptide repeat-containing protein [Nonomuraea spiralis]GGT02182.1 hypothetical protein GCM10010176_052990 [Nonomuraea spiralis]
MGLFPRPPRVSARPREPRPPRVSARPPELRPPRSMWWWTLPAALLIGAAAWATTAWLLQDLNTVPVSGRVAARIEAVRTALAAAAGVGAAVTLLLAVRRQRHQELATAHTTHDANERRVTELYTKAVEHLGSDQAAIRLGGMYALERLAEHTPALQGTVAEVICAYLRGPWTPPARRKASAVPAGPDPREERQVRLAAQRILARHLHHSPPPARRWWQPRDSGDADRLHWPGTRLDLTGATLVDFEFVECRVADADFREATFAGETMFAATTFTGRANFAGATFTGDASFTWVTFADGHPGLDGADFDGATFADDASFRHATFTRSPRFERTAFLRDAVFDGAVFGGGARFVGTAVVGEVSFVAVKGLEMTGLPAGRQRWRRIVRRRGRG